MVLTNTRGKRSKWTISPQKSGQGWRPTRAWSNYNCAPLLRGINLPPIVLITQIVYNARFRVHGTKWLPTCQRLHLRVHTRSAMGVDSLDAKMEVSNLPPYTIHSNPSNKY